MNYLDSLKQQHPDIAKYSDEEILSILPEINPAVAGMSTEDIRAFAMTSKSSGLLDIMGSGYDNVIGSREKARAAKELNQLNDPQFGDVQGVKPDRSSFLGMSADELRRRSVASQGGEDQLIDEAQAELDSSNARLDAAAKVSLSPTTQQFLTGANPDSSLWDDFAADPITIIAEIGAQSAYGSVEAAGTGLLAAPAGPIGIGAASGLGSGRIEFANTVVEELDKAGVNTRDARALKDALAKNPELYQHATSNALKRAAAIGTLDAVTMGIASKTLGVGSGITKQVTNLGAQGVVQSTGGASGEALGQYVTEGEVADVRAVAAEAVGELVTAPVDVYVATRNYMTEASNKVAQARQDTAAAGGDALDQALAGGQVQNETVPGAVAEESKQSQAQQSHRDMSGIDGLIISARRMGFAEEESRLLNAQALYERGNQYRQQGDIDTANRLFSKANAIYQDVTEANAPLKAESGNYPVPYVFAGGPVEAGFPVPRDNTQWTVGRDDVDGRGTSIPQPQTSLPGSQGLLLPSGTGQINLGRDKPERAFAPIDPSYAGVGENIAQRQAPSAPGLPQGSQARTVTQTQMIDLQQRYRKAITTPVSKRTEADTQAVAQYTALKRGEISVTPDAVRAGEYASDGAYSQQAGASLGRNDSVAFDLPKADQPSGQPHAVIDQPVPATKARKGVTLNTTKHTFAQAIALAGGMSRQAALDMGVDPAHFKDRTGGMFGKPVIRKTGGLSEGALYEILSQEGVEYVKTQEEFRQRFFDHLAGKAHYTSDGYVRQAEIEAEERARFEQEADPVIEGQTNEESLLSIASFEAYTAGVPEAKIDAIIQQNADDELTIALELRNAIEQLHTERDQAGHGNQGLQGTDPQTDLPAGRPITAEDVWGAESDQQDDFQLGTYTEQELAEKAQRENDQATAAAADDQAFQDSSAESFTLNTSQGAADEQVKPAVSGGSVDMFGTGQSSNGQANAERREFWVFAPDDLDSNGDRSFSPWLLANGAVISTMGDHIEYSESLGLDGYNDVTRSNGALRASFVIDPAGKESFVMVQTVDGVPITPAQMSTIKRFAKKNNAQIMHNRMPADAKPFDTSKAPQLMTFAEFESSIGQANAIESKDAAPQGKQAEPDQAQQSTNKLDNAATAIDDEIAAVGAELAALLKAQSGRLNSGVDPTILVLGAKLGALYVSKGVVKFAQYSKAILEQMKALGVDSGEVKPLLKEFYAATQAKVDDDAFEQMDDMRTVRKFDLNTLNTQESDNVKYPASNQESDSSDRKNETSEAAGDISADGRGAGRPRSVTAGAQASEDASADSAVGDGGTATSGKRSDKQFYSEKSRLEASAAGDSDGGRSGQDSTGGLYAERKTDGALDSVLEGAPVDRPKTRLTKGKVAPGDIEQIKQQMPFLTEGQAEDVAFAEKRFSKEDGFGVLFTNGTGTGKTFTGLGVVKRLAKQGKRNILIAAPKQTIAEAWIKAGADFFGLEITRLEDTNDAGKGIVITTYANMGENKQLLNREWDAVVMDEAHYLSSNEAGDGTKALDTLQGMTLKRGSEMRRVYAQESELVSEMHALQAKAKLYRTSDNQDLWYQADGLEAQAKEIGKQLDDKVAAEKARVAKIADKDKPRALFLSATPFSYEKSVRWANEFLFDWGRGENGLSYNSGGNYEQFMMAHFGYRMRHNKLTQPNSKVDNGLMQRAFNSWLKKEGALSGRSLDSDFDYDRRFVLAESAIGKRVDDAIEWLREHSRGESKIAGMDDLQELIVGKNFDYHARMYFLEAIKGYESIGHIKEHLALSRKVLVMHDFKKGGATNPFRVMIGQDSEMADAYAAFRAEFDDLINAFGAFPSPIDQLSSEFPGALIYNGDISAKKRIAMQDAFNSDDAGSPMIMIAQGDAMREGVSIHDTTGKHPRVMVHLGMPVKPTASIQQEGRTYRTGQGSDALFRYFTIGTNWERAAFASKIAGRAGAAENLAMGEQARGLKQSFIEAYENADTYPPGFDGEGKGGKESDAAFANLLTPWDIAKSYYFGSKKQGAGRGAKGREHSEYFATPEPLGLKMVHWADIQGGESVLEPSAGHGAIARWLPENTTNRAIEYTHELSSKLALYFDGDLQTADFLEHHVVNKYDAIVMNPPFGQGGKDAALHVAKAIKHLRDGGRIVALIPTGPAADKRFDKLLYSDEAKDIYLAASIDLPAVTFERAGTSVATKVLVLERQTDADQAAKIQQVNLSYSGEDTIKGLFDRLEDSEIPARTPTKAALANAEGASIEAKGVSFSVMDSEHTKTGADLFVVNLSGDMGDNYSELNGLAKQNDGFYVRAKLRSYYKPKDDSEMTGTPTFVFKTPEGRQAFMAAIGEDAPLFSRSPKQSVAPLRKVKLDAVIDRVASVLKGRGGIVVVPDFSALPAAIQQDAKKQGSDGSDVDGVFHNGKIYIVSDSITSEAQAEALLFHEATHGGIEAMLGSRQVKAALNKVFLAMGGSKGFNDIVDALGIRDKLKPYLKGVVGKDANGKSRFDAETRNAILIHELLAFTGEQGSKSVKLRLQELVGAIRSWLRENGYLELAKLNTADIAHLAKSAREYALQGNTGMKAVAAFSLDSSTSDAVISSKSTDEEADSMDDDKRMDRAEAMGFDTGAVWFHGTNEKFESFDMAKGGQNFGDQSSKEGIFLAAQRGNADLYGDHVMELYAAFQNAKTISAEELITSEYDYLVKRREFDGSFEEFVSEYLEDDPYGFYEQGQLNSDIRAAKQDGHDALIVDFGSMEMDRGGKFAVAFAPEQLASTDAKFDQADLNPAGALFSRRSPVAEAFAAPTDSYISTAISKIADKFNVLKDLQSSIKESGSEIEEAADAYMAEELFHGKAENDLRQMRTTFVEPLAKKMAEFGITRAKLDEYLYAKHAPERNAHIAEINPELQDGGSGMTDAEAAQIVDAVQASGKQGEYEQVAAIVYDMLAARREQIRGAGLEDSGLIDAWESSYQHYVPLKGFAADERKDGLPRTGKGFTIGGKESKRAMGRSSEASSPLSNTIQDLTETLIRKRKNEVGNVFLKLVEENPNTGYWQVFTDESPEMDRRIVKRKNADTGQMEEIVKEQPIPMAMMTDRYFTTKRDGKTYYIKLEDPRLMKAMKNIGPDTSNFLIQGLSKVTRLLSSLNTSYNPEFVVGNFARDIQTAILNLSAEQTRDDGKINGEKIVKQVVKDVPKAMRAAYRGLRDKAPKNAEWAKWFDEFREAGAKTGYFDMKDIDGQAQDVQRLIDIANGGLKGGWFKWTKAAARLVEDANNAVENAVRLSAYVNARKAGISKAKAASLAKNMTVNFNRRGEVGTTLNAWYMFANASIQGTMNFTRTMVGLKGEKGDPMWSRLNTAQKVAVGLMGAAYGIAMANRMAAGDDDDGENWYDKVPQYVKERNIVLMKSLFGGEQDGSYWKIPLPYGYNIFHVFGTSTEAVTNGTTDVGQAATDLALAALGSFSPLGFQDSDSVHGMILKNVTPTIGKPVVDVALNENFMGSSIYNENFPFGTPKPDSALSRRSTPEGYKAIAEFLNDVSGGSQWRSGAIDINPDVMRYFVDYFTGGAGAFVASKAPKNIYNLYNGVELPAHRAVFFSRVNGQVLPYEDQSKFYDRRDEIGQIQEEFKALKGAERIAFYRENKDKLALRGQIKSTENQLKLLRKQRDRIYGMNLSPALQDRKLKEIELKMKAVVDRFNLRYGKAG